MEQHFTLIALSAVLLLPTIFAALPEVFRGIAPQDLKYYEGNIIWCKDKSKSFPKSRLNDDFCDCVDGTDEPGTSACPEGKFYCKNQGHSPQILFSSRVNDGICDCCDGSDEYDGRKNCPNTCWEAGRKSRERLEKKVKTFQEGYKQRIKEIDAARVSIKREEVQLAALKQEEKAVKDVAEKLKVQVDEIEAAEKEERERKDKEESERRAKEEHENKTKEELLNTSNEGQTGELDVPSTDDSISVTESSNEELITANDESTDKIEEIEEVTKENMDSSTGHGMEDSIGEVSTLSTEEKSEHSEDMDSLSKEELGRLVASRWTGEKAYVDEEKDSNKNTYVDEEKDSSENIYDENSPSTEGDLSENEEEEQSYDDDDDDDDSYNEALRENKETSDGLDSVESDSFDSDSMRTKWTRKFYRMGRTALSYLGFRKTSFDVSDAAKIRKEYGEANTKLSGLRSKIAELEKKHKLDFGKEGEFFSFYGQCFEKKHDKYTYKVCPYKHATQEEGHSSTRLGNWEGFNNEYKVMRFHHGDHCWNGPQRSLTVKLRCGLKSEVTSVDEPSRCEYVAEFTTPVVCLEERLKVFQQQLSELRQLELEHSQVNDEL